VKSGDPPRHCHCSVAGVAIRILIAAAVLLVSARPSSASCVGYLQGPCNRFWNVETVFVAKVIDKVPLPEPDLEVQPEYEVILKYRLQVRVVEAFRGVKAGAVMTLFAFRDEGGVDAEDGSELFIYASRNKTGELWARGCLSRTLERADADLAYARSVSGHGPPALVYGDVTHAEEDDDGDFLGFAAMAGVRVRVAGKDFTVETQTDAEGNYAITLAAAGQYSIEVIPPEGFADESHDGPVRFEIADPRACHRAQFQLQLDGRIRGQVIDSDGQPVANLIVQTRDRTKAGKTDDSGRFEIGPLEKGFYRLSPVTGGHEDSFDSLEPVEVHAGQTTEVAPLIFNAGDLVTLSVEINGPWEADGVQLLVTVDGSELGEPLTLKSGTTKFLIAKDQQCKIIAAGLKYLAQATVRSVAPDTTVTLTLRPAPPEQ
jgi:hypothetical protein